MKQERENKIINKPRKVARVSFLICALMIAGAVITGYSGMDGMRGGFALISLFGFFAMVALVTALVYLPRAREFDKLIFELKPLAHWTYSQKEWNDFIKEDLKESLAINKATLRLVLMICLVIGIALLFIYQDSFFILIISGIMLLASIAALSAPYIRRRILKKGVHEAFIGENSAYVGGTFQTWTKLGAKCTGADLYTESTIPILHIIFEVPTMQGAQEEVVRIPVPTGKLDEAKKIIGKLKERFHLNT